MVRCSSVQPNPQHPTHTTSPSPQVVQALPSLPHAEVQVLLSQLESRTVDIASPELAASEAARAALEAHVERLAAHAAQAQVEAKEAADRVEVLQRVNAQLAAELQAAKGREQVGDKVSVLPPVRNRVGAGNVRDRMAAPTSRFPANWHSHCLHAPAVLRSCRWPVPACHGRRHGSDRRCRRARRGGPAIIHTPSVCGSDGGVPMCCTLTK